jgi:vacuolar protein sorting-associated protein 26
MLFYFTDARRYFKQSEIALFRQAPEIAATPQIAQQQQIQQQVLMQQQQAVLPPGSATAGPGREVSSAVNRENKTPAPVSAPAA